MDEKELAEELFGVYNDCEYTPPTRMDKIQELKAQIKYIQTSKEYEEFEKAHLIYTIKQEIKSLEA